jgi:hypothetical protein
MTMPYLSEAQIGEISGLVSTYIQGQRQNFVGRASNLPSMLHGQMNGFFRPEILHSTHILALQDERVRNPDFYPMLRALGLKDLPEFDTMAAITFEDVIVSHEAFTAPLVFHELVHVEQYRQLGIARFSELYVRGFLLAGSYEAIPLELNAYGLEGVFRQTPHRRFSVEDEVSAWIQKGQL